MHQLFHQLAQFNTLSDAAKVAISNCFEQVVLKKNDMLLQEGSVCKKMYFVEKGVVRGYYILDGKEISHWFGFENDFVTSFHSFITQQPAVENIQLLEGSILWAIDKNTMYDLSQTHADIERLVRIAYEKYYIRLEERLVNGQFKTAAALYHTLLQQTPHIIERVPLGYIASYLGITQETLSRIRQKL
jgi:CRP-like cAMP-binding protein